MKIFGFEIKKFEQKPTTMQAVETWVVSWRSISSERYSGLNDGIYNTKIRFNTFLSEKSALDYANELKMARMLLGDIPIYLEVYKQKTPTNVGA